MAPEIDRKVRMLEREVITQSEFFYCMLDALGYFPAEERQAILAALAGHSSDSVREAVVKLQVFLRNQALSRNIEHVRRNSPLRPGMRLELCGDYCNSSEGHLRWLSGGECCTATFLRFERLGENLTPVAFVEFDEAIDIPGHKGRYGVMFTRYGCDSPAWVLPEEDVAICVVEALPNDMKGFCDSHPFTERHVRCRVQETPDEPTGSIG